MRRTTHAKAKGVALLGRWRKCDAQMKQQRQHHAVRVQAPPSPRREHEESNGHLADDGRGGCGGSDESGEGLRRVDAKGGGKSQEEHGRTTDVRVHEVLVDLPEPRREVKDGQLHPRRAAPPHADIRGRSMSREA